MLGPRTFWIIGAAGVLSVLSACNSKPQRAPSIGVAYAGPETLKLHQEIDSKSPAVASANHGDKLDIVGQRRRWYKVRTAAGAEGWVSDRELLDRGQMQRLLALAGETAGLPSQGIATTFSNLNVHTEPSRQSPSFVQVKEHEKVDVIAHRVAQRVAAAPKRELVPAKPKPENKAAKKEVKGKAAKIPPPPPGPAPPVPPADWLELSREHDPPPVVDEGAAAGPVDDWTLIRTEGGQSGWVLTSGLYLAIPDEVAQYAEGHRITSYFSLGKVQDGDEKKDIWLWTISDQLGEDHDFDGYRVFTWSLRRHRYETAYIQRRERGFFPVLAKTGEFSVCLEGKDGLRVRKQYTLVGNAVRPAGQRPCENTGGQDAGSQPSSKPDAVNERTGPKGLVDRVKEEAKGLLGK